ncbi:hypothetical protein LSAT2_024074 [Lamellibrachia satsuma]|nr:hypothetical protein LSAT2_024074 [Lamellibrachia satsuma]
MEPCKLYAICHPLPFPNDERTKGAPSYHRRAPCTLLHPPYSYPSGILYWAESKPGAKISAIDNTTRVSQDFEGNLYFANVEEQDKTDGDGYVCIVNNEILCSLSKGDNEEIYPIDGAGHRETGRKETGRKGTGGKTTGVKERGVGETGGKEKGVGETGGKTTGVKERGVAETGGKEKGVGETGGKTTGVKERGVGETGGKEKGVGETEGKGSGQNAMEGIERKSYSAAVIEGVRKRARVFVGGFDS